jgi:leader peptidase (prepilin peptidase)/N-methyltransferase
VALTALAWWARAPALLGGALAGGAVFAGCYALVRLLAPASLGAGDVKLAGSLGAVVGSVSVPAVPLCVLAAAVLTLVGALPLRGRAVPHGPCMLAPAWLVTALLPAAGR